jgi:hypothetical protein
MPSGIRGCGDALAGAPAAALAVALAPASLSSTAVLTSRSIDSPYIPTYTSLIVSMTASMRLGRIS